MNFKGQVITFRSDAVAADLLLVTKLSGVEKMSGLFEFSIELICPRADLDLDAVLYAPARLGLEVPAPLGDGQFGTTTREIAGILAALEQSEKGQGWTKYRATFVPKLWQLTRSFRSRIFMDKTVDQLIGAVLEADGLSPQVDFEWKLSRQGKAGPTPERAIYPQREYVVQYEESDWDFVARWLEHEGIWFYFVNADGDGQQSTEKVVFGDTPSTYGASEFESNIPYRPESEGKGNDRREAGQVTTFRCRQQRLPTKVAVNDYNWRTPSAELLLEATVHEQGTGVQIEYNDHFKTSDQGEAIATLRAEELSCRARWFHGESDCRTLRAGHTFTLRDHYRDDWNDSYLVVEIHHQAEQMISLESSSVTGVKYANTFQCIPASQAYRPERRTAWPSIKGVMHARVDAEGDGKYAELDEFGRYKLVFPFDEHAADAKPGKASRWVRLAQPYAGPGGGMHFPLLKGTEVLVTHVDGDPDRPIIAGAVPNAELPSPASANNPSQNTIRTASGSVFQIDDNESVSGFFSADARCSRVVDHRWRTPGATLPPTPSSPGGNGGAVVAAGPAPEPLRSTAALPSGGHGMPDVVSTLSNTNVAQDATCVPAWKTFFGLNPSGANSALTSVTTRGRYSDETNAPLQLTQQTDGVTDNQGVSEASIVERLNKLLENHNRSGAWGTPLAVASTALEGRAAHLATTVQNFEGTISGSQLGITCGDSISLRIGDTYDYLSCSRQVSVNAGGTVITETLGDVTRKNTSNGDVDETETTKGDKSTKTTFLAKRDDQSYFLGNKASFSVELSGTQSMTLIGGIGTVTELKLGGFNTNSIQLLGALTTNIMVGGRLDIEINAAIVGKIQLGSKNEFELQSTRVWMKSQDVALKKFVATLKETDVKLALESAAVSANAAKVSSLENSISSTNSKISSLENSLSTQTSALSDVKNSLSDTQNKLNSNISTLNTSFRTLANNQLAAVHVIA